MTEVEILKGALSHFAQLDEKEFQSARGLAPQPVQYN